MLVAGLTGGIGTGKSAFAALLAERGAHVVDADELARDELRPGRSAWHSVVDQFGREVLAENSLDIDRARLAAIVFADREKLAALNAIVHPRVLEGIALALEQLKNSDAIVVIDAPLLVEVGLERGLDVLIVVTAPEDVRFARLRRARGMTKEQVSARMAHQLPEEDLVRRAQIVVRNSGSLDDLAREADRVWEELVARRDA